MPRRFDLAALVDPFLGCLIATAAAAVLVPVGGEAGGLVDDLAQISIFVLFFLHGAKLSLQDIQQGASKWKLHAGVLLTSFVVYPAVGLLAFYAVDALSPGIAAGLLYLSLLPSTIQSSIVMTSIAGGDVPAAIASASLSSIVGIVATPLLAKLLMASGDDHRGYAGLFLDVGFEILLPFVLGFASRPLTGRFIARRHRLLSFVDYGSILILVYSALSDAVVGGVLRQTSPTGLLIALVAGILMVLAVLSVTRVAARLLGWPQEDEIVLRFCGSKKSLTTGIALAGAIFPERHVGLLMLPMMMQQETQLLICSVLARRYSLSTRRSDA